MKNLKNYTKAELISKLNSVKQNNNNNNKDSIFTIFMTFLLTIKSFLLKITLIALIIKIFRKYNIFRKIFTIINTILFSIFGFSLIDFYEIEFLSKYFHKIMDIFANFNSSILELFGKKGDIPVNNPSKSMGNIQSETTGIQKSNDQSNRIIERYKKIIHGEETKPDITPEIIQEDTPYYKNKYVIIAGLLILSCLAWYYSDEIRPVGTTILTWINLMRSRRNNDQDPDNNEPPVNTTSNAKENTNNIEGAVEINSRWNLNKKLKDFKESVKRKVYGESKDENISSQESIKLTESSRTSDMDHYYPNKDDERVKGKTVATGELSQAELERRGIVPQITGFQEITGDPLNFWREGEMIRTEIESFTNNYKGDRFPRNDLAQASYNVISNRIDKWRDANPEIFNRWKEFYYNGKTLDEFKELQADLNFFDTGDYSDVEKAATEEQEIWSNRGNSPQVLSPQLIAETAMETVEKNKPKLVIESIDDTKSEDKPISSVELKSYWDTLKDKTKKIFNNSDNLLFKDEEIWSDNIDGPSGITLEMIGNKVDNDIENSKNSSPESMKDYFKKDESTDKVEKTKTVDDSKIEITKIDLTEEQQKTLSKHATPRQKVIEDIPIENSNLPNIDWREMTIIEKEENRIKDLNLVIESRNDLLVENFEPNLFDQEPVKVESGLQLDVKTALDKRMTEGIYSQESFNQNKELFPKVDEHFYSKKNIEKNVQERPDLAESLRIIKSKRLEYGSPSVANVGLPRPDLSPLILNPDNTSNLPINEGIDLEDNQDDLNNRDSNNDAITLHDWEK